MENTNLYVLCRRHKEKFSAFQVFSHEYDAIVAMDLLNHINGEKKFYVHKYTLIRRQNGHTWKYLGGK